MYNLEEVSWGLQSIWKIITFSNLGINRVSRPGHCSLEGC
jgi:hypothetical protein